MSGCPDAVLASIAWYPDALDDERRGLVEAHLASCAACREELAFVQGELEPELALPDPDAVYSGVLARIERNEREARARAAATPARKAAAGRRTPSRRRRRPGDGLGSRPAAWAAGLALAVCCGALGVLGGMLLAGDRAPVYQTVAEAPVARGVSGAAPAPALDVVFRADASAEQVHDALRAIGGQIVSGPTPVGVYRVELPEAADLTAAARLLERGDAAEGEGRGAAAFAQPAR